MKNVLVFSFYLLLLGSCNGKQESLLTTREAGFKGGHKAMQKWLIEHVIYPDEAIEDDVQGRVIVEFVVTPTGKVQFSNFVKRVAPSLDREAKRLIRIMPDWKPAVAQGKPVAQRCRLPINFELD